MPGVKAATGSRKAVGDGILGRWTHGGGGDVKLVYVKHKSKGEWYQLMHGSKQMLELKNYAPEFDAKAKEEALKWAVAYANLEKDITDIKLLKTEFLQMHGSESCRLRKQAAGVAGDPGHGTPAKKPTPKGKANGKAKAGPKPAAKGKAKGKAKAAAAKRHPMKRKKKKTDDDQSDGEDEEAEEETDEDERDSDDEDERASDDDGEEPEAAAGDDDKDEPSEVASKKPTMSDASRAVRKRPAAEEVEKKEQPVDEAVKKTRATKQPKKEQPVDEAVKKDAGITDGDGGGKGLQRVQKDKDIRDTTRKPEKADKKHGDTMVAQALKDNPVVQHDARKGQSAFFDEVIDDGFD